MENTLDIFECFSDGTKLWREAIVGAESAKKRIEELASASTNRFAAIDLIANRVVANSIEQSSLRRLL